MTKTNTETETIEFLWEHSRGKNECKVNRFFIDRFGRIVEHGYLQGKGDIFPTIPNGIEVWVQKGTKKKDIIERVKAATLPDKWCTVCQNPIPEGNTIRVELGKNSPHERTVFACSNKCARILGKK